MCQNVIFVEHWSTSVEAATVEHKQWGSECPLTHAHSCLGFQLFMADVDQTMSSGFWLSTGLWVVSDVSEEHVSILSVTEFCPGIYRKKGRIKCSLRKVQFHPFEPTLPYLCHRNCSFLFFTLHCHPLEPGKGSHICNDIVYLFMFGTMTGAIKKLSFFHLYYSALHLAWTEPCPLSLSMFLTGQVACKLHI